MFFVNFESEAVEIRTAASKHIGKAHTNVRSSVGWLGAGQALSVSLEYLKRK